MEKITVRTPIRPTGFRRVLCHIFPALVALFIVLPLSLMFFDRQFPVLIEYGEITPNPVFPGQVVEISWVGKKVVDGCTGTFVRRLTDSAGYVIETNPAPTIATDILQLNETKKFSKEFVVPPMQQGEATYQVVRKASCNWVQRYVWPITDVSKPVKFTVGIMPGGLMPGQKITPPLSAPEISTR